MDEFWADLEDFPYYAVSNLGNIYSKYINEELQTSINQYGEVKISLWSPEGRKTVPVKNLVAKAFLPRPLDMFGSVINLDGNHANARVDNLAWRPRWFAWRYTNQFRRPLPEHFYTVPVVNYRNNLVFDSIHSAAITGGVLFKDVERSIFTHRRVFPLEGPYGWAGVSIN